MILLRNLCYRWSVTVLVLLLTSVSFAQSEEAWRAYNRRDFASAFSLFNSLASQGDPEAQCQLGVMYANGYGIERSRLKAVDYFRMAAEQGYAQAEYFLGTDYYFGYVGHDGKTSEYGLPEPERDLKSATEWYLKAAKQGYRDAQWALGLAYFGGNGVPQDLELAAKWLEKADQQGESQAAGTLTLVYDQAAEYGYPWAQYQVGMNFYKGDGVPQDYVQAYKWWNLSAARGHQEAKLWRDKISQAMTREQLAEAQKLSREWKPWNRF